MFLSIIIPVYNTEHFLVDCIESLLNQSFRDFELLLIDDGSTDNSKVICKKYQQLDIRVKYYFKNNEGVSSARNFGLDISLGKYVLFVDSDDLILENSFDFINNIELFDKDIYMFKTCTLKNSIIEEETKVKEACFKNAIWRYMFKREIIDQNSLRFIAIKYSEDFNFVAKMFSLSKSIEFIDRFIYIYRLDTPNSAMNKKKGVNFLLDHFIMINDLSKFRANFINKIDLLFFNKMIVLAFKMTLLVIAKSSLSFSSYFLLLNEYSKIYFKFSDLKRFYLFHPMFFFIWLFYYRIRLNLQRYGK